MKKSLAILGLLVCTTGVVFADELTTVTNTAPTQVEIQNQLDRTNFQRTEMNQKFNKSLKNDNTIRSDKIKYDKSVKEGNFRNARPKIENKTSQFNPKFKDKKSPNNRFAEYRPHRHGDMHRPHYPQHKRGYVKNAHRPNIHSHKISRRTAINRRAYNKVR